MPLILGETCTVNAASGNIAIGGLIVSGVISSPHRWHRGQTRRPLERRRSGGEFAGLQAGGEAGRRQFGGLLDGRVVRQPARRMPAYRFTSAS